VWVWGESRASTTPPIRERREAARRPSLMASRAGPALPSGHARSLAYSGGDRLGFGRVRVAVFQLRDVRLLGAAVALLLFDAHAEIERFGRHRRLLREAPDPCPRLV